MPKEETILQVYTRHRSNRRNIKRREDERNRALWGESDEVDIYMQKYNAENGTHFDRQYFITHHGDQIWLLARCPFNVTACNVLRDSFIGTSLASMLNKCIVRLGVLHVTSRRVDGFALRVVAPSETTGRRRASDKALTPGCRRTVGT